MGGVSIEGWFEWLHPVPEGKEVFEEDGTEGVGDGVAEGGGHAV